MPAALLLAAALLAVPGRPGAAPFDPAACSELVRAEDGVALAPKRWTTVGAAVPALELPAVDGSGPVDLARLVGAGQGTPAEGNGTAPDGLPCRTLVLHFAAWDAASRRLTVEWVEATRADVAAGRLRLVGIAQEQHPDRTALFAELHGLDFPILWDPFALSGLERVPLAVAVDEAGIVRAVGPDPRTFKDGLQPTFVEPLRLPTLRAPEPGPAPRATAPAFRTTEAARDGRDATRRALGRLLLSAPAARHGAATLDADVAALERAARGPGANPAARFRLGVALRMRSETERARSDDFQRALDAWRAALIECPEHLVWRRRIQGYGPLLDRPGSFYGWAREAVQAGAQLTVPLGTGESADRSTRIPGSRPDAGAVAPPEETAALPRDAGAFVRLETAVALNTGAVGHKVRIPAGAARVHLTLRPRGETQWAAAPPGALDVEPPEVWLEVPAGWQADARRIRFRRAGAGAEPIRVEFEVSTVPFVPSAPDGDGNAEGDAASAPSESHAAPVRCFGGFAVYRVLPPGSTESVRVRQDFEFCIELSAPQPHEEPRTPDGAKPDGAEAGDKTREGDGR